ncbi:MAG: large conductance mechanosensitive channel protein MscL [Sphingobium sp.]|nr:large conductance mechanosensitive channel protein MscL [Sphingobium sp.]
MFSEFKAFIARGNVLDLAVGVIIGAAFGKIVTSLTEDVIMPVIGWLTGGVDFSNRFIQLSAIPADFKGDPAKYADLKAAGVAMVGLGSFITAIINFLILAFVIFLIVRQANKVMSKPEAAPAGPSQIDLLTEIRDALKK